MDLHLIPRSWSQVGFRILILAVWLVSVPAGAQDKVPRFIKYTVQDSDGNFFPIGEVEFCTPEGQCFYADIEEDFPGHFLIPSKMMEPGVAYAVRIYDIQVAVIMEMHNWVFVPRDYDAFYDRLVGVDKFLVFPRFHGDQDGGMTFQIDVTLNPEWALRKNLPRFTGPDTLPDFPRLVAGFQIPVMLGGKFRTDNSAIGGVDDVRPGLGLSGTYRHGYPSKRPPRDEWIFFRETTLAYQQNRYETWEVITPGRRSDVTFHRLKFSYGMGQMNQSYSSHWSVAVTMAAAAVFDGPQVLKYLDRTYKRFGVGCKATWLQRLFQVGRIDVGASLQLELMYYFADNGPDDYWFGTAPSASFGLVVF